MKAVTITVTDAVARKLVRLAKTGRVTPDRDGYKAYCLLTEHARPFPLWREVVVDGVTYVAPEALSCGRR